MKKPVYNNVKTVYDKILLNYYFFIYALNFFNLKKFRKFDLYVFFIKQIISFSIGIVSN